MRKKGLIEALDPSAGKLMINHQKKKNLLCIKCLFNC